MEENVHVNLSKIKYKKKSSEREKLLTKHERGLHWIVKPHDKNKHGKGPESPNITKRNSYGHEMRYVS